MRVNDRLHVGFDKGSWAGVGIWVSMQTLWVDFLGLYFNLYIGRAEKDA